MLDLEWLNNTYQQLVNKLFESESPMLIPNCGITHQQIICTLIIKNTDYNQTVYIYSDDFSKEFFEEKNLMNEIKKAKERGVLFCLACSGICQSQYLKEMFVVSENKPKLIERKKQKEFSINFLTNGTAVWLHEENNQESKSSANDPKAAEKLITTFYN